VIYSYNKSQRDALFLNFILIYNSTCFGQTYCPSSGVLILYSQQLVFVILTPDDGQQICPKHVELYIKIKLRNSHLVGFYYTNSEKYCVTKFQFQRSVEWMFYRTGEKLDSKY
jgi:hypothetical protein